MDANVTFGNVFADGFKTSAAVTAIMIVFTIISLKLLFPEMIDKALEQAQANMSKQNNMSEEQIETAMTMTKKFFIPFAIGGALIIYLLIGAIASLIGAAAAKKNPRDPFNQPG
jgi:NADH:ubiquinone oxidoreductase subunit 6 (subunit J)